MEAFPTVSLLNNMKTWQFRKNAHDPAMNQGQKTPQKRKQPLQTWLDMKYLTKKNLILLLEENTLENQQKERKYSLL